MLQDDFNKFFGPSPTPTPNQPVGGTAPIVDPQVPINDFDKFFSAPVVAPPQVQAPAAPKAPPATGVEPRLWDYLKQLPGEAVGQIKDIAAHPIDTLTKPYPGVQNAIRSGVSAVGQLGGAFAQPQAAGEAMFGKGPAPSSLSPGAVEGITRNLASMVETPLGLSASGIMTALPGAGPAGRLIGGLGAAALGTQAGMTGFPNTVEANQKADERVQAAQKKIELAKAAGNTTEAQIAQAELQKAQAEADAAKVDMIGQGLMIVGGMAGAGHAANEIATPAVEGLAARRNAQAMGAGVKAAEADIASAPNTLEPEAPPTATTSVQGKFNRAQSEAAAKGFGQGSERTGKMKDYQSPTGTPPPAGGAAPGSGYTAQAEEPNMGGTRGVEPVANPAQPIRPVQTAPDTMTGGGNGETILPFGSEMDPSGAQAEYDAVIEKARAEQAAQTGTPEPKAGIVRNGEETALSQNEIDRQFLERQEAEKATPRGKKTMEPPPEAQFREPALKVTEAYNPSEFDRFFSEESPLTIEPGSETRSAGAKSQVDWKALEDKALKEAADKKAQSTQHPAIVKLSEKGYIEPAQPEIKPQEGYFLSNSGDLHKVSGADHEAALLRSGLLGVPREKGMSFLAQSLKDNNLVRIRNAATYLGIEMGIRPSSAQLSALAAHITAVNKPVALDAYKPGDLFSDIVPAKEAVDAIKSFYSGSRGESSRPVTLGSEEHSIEDNVPVREQSPPAGPTGGFLTFRKQQLSKNPSLDPRAIRPMWEISKGAPLESAVKHLSPEVAEIVRQSNAPQGPAKRRIEAKLIQEIEGGASIPGSRAGERLFHGTQRPFDEFSDDKANYSGEDNLYGPGHYFTDDPEVASSYAMNKRPPSYPMTDTERAEYFTPGNIVPSYGGGNDRVVAYSPSSQEHGGWAVKVQAVIKSPSGKWIDDPRSPHERVHFTEPFKKPRIQPNVRKATTNVKKWFDVAATADPAELRRITERLGGDFEEPSKPYSNDELYSDIVEFLGSRTEANEYLKKFGYEGIKYPGGERVKGTTPHQAYVVFSKNSIFEGKYPLAESRPGERGSFRFGGKKPAPKNPFPNDPKYTKIFEAQHKAPPSKLSEYIEALKTLPERSKAQLDRDLDMHIDFKKLEDEIGSSTGTPVSPEDSVYNQATLTWGGGMGKTEATFIRQAQIDLKAEKAGLDNELRAYRNLKGNIRAIETAEAKATQARNEEHRFRAQGKRAEANEQGRVAKSWEDRLAQDKIAAANYSLPELRQRLSDLESNLGPQKFAEVKGFAQEGFDLNRKALDAAHDEGTISDNVFNELIKEIEYVNMHRIMDQLDDERLRGGSTMNLRAQHGVKALTGSERINKDPSIADPENRGIIYRDIEQNKVGRKLHELATTDPGGFGRLVREEGPKVKGPSHDEGIVTYLRDGKQVKLIVPKVYADAVAAGASANAVTMFGAEALSASGKLFKSLYTSLNPAFAGPNLIKDIGGTLVLTDANVTKYMKALGTATKDYLTKNPKYLEFLESGAAYAGLQHQIDPMVRMNKLMGRSGGMIVVKQLGEFSAMVESLSKMASLEEQKARGINPTTAAANARQLAGNPDVSNAGQRLKDANKILLFFASKAKDYERNVRFAARDPKRLLKLMLGVAVTEVMLEEYNRRFQSPENPDQKEWDLVSDSDKQNYNTILLPIEWQTTKGEKRLWGVKIPRQRLSGEILGANIADAYSAALGRKSTEEAYLGGAKDRPWSTTAGAAVSSLHPLIQAPIEQVANKETYTMTPIVPESLKAEPPVLQYDERTSPTAVKIGHAIHAVDNFLGKYTKDLEIESPKRIEHLMKTFGPPGEMITSVLDRPQIKSETTKQGPEGLANALLVGPILRRFVISAGNEKRRTTEEEFYQKLSKADIASKGLYSGFESNKERVRTISEISNDPEKLTLAAMSPNLRKVADSLKKLRNALMNISQSPQKDEFKREHSHEALQAYDALLNNTNEGYTALLEKVKTLSPRQRIDMTSGILKRNTKLTPEPDVEETK